MCKLKLVQAHWPHSNWWLIDALQQYGSALTGWVNTTNLWMHLTFGFRQWFSLRFDNEHQHNTICNNCSNQKVIESNVLNAQHKKKHKMIKRLCKTKKKPQKRHNASLHFILKFLDKKTCSSTFQNNAKNNTWERHRFVFCCEPHGSVAPLNSVQLALSCTCTITVSHLYFSPKISPNLFEASLYLFLTEWEACLFSVHSAVYTSAEGHFFANACFSGRLFVKCIMTCAYPEAESLRWNEVG